MSKLKSFIYPGVRGEPVKISPGIYQDVPFETYLSWNAISNSSLGAAVQDAGMPPVISMAHYYHQEPLSESPEILFGKVAHAAKFEFLTALKNYVTVPDLINFDIDPDGNLFESQCKTKLGKPTDSKASDSYQERLARCKAMHAGKQFIEQEEYERVQGVLYGLDCHPLAREYFANHGPKTDRELSIVWKEPGTGLLCKGRIDCAQHDSRLVVDLKTTPKAADFPRSIVKFNYHRQAAFYCDGMTILTGDRYSAAVVIAERTRPHEVAAAPFAQSALMAGRDQYRRILTQIAASIEAEAWPFPDSPKEWDIPPWAMPDITMEDAEPLAVR